jgi:hypothetical protein
MRTKRTLAVRFSEPSGLLAYSAAPARNAAMSMMKPVDNHTTSIGMIEIMGSRTGRFTRNDSVHPLVLRAPAMVHHFWRATDKKLRPGHGSIAKTEDKGDIGNDAPADCRARVPSSRRAIAGAGTMSAAAGHGTARRRWDADCAAPGTVASPCRSPREVGVVDEYDLAAEP